MRQLLFLASAAVLIYSIVHDPIGNPAATTILEPNITCGNLTCYGPNTVRCNLTDQEPCECKVGFDGPMCESDFDECKKGHPCRNRGPCTNTLGSFSCTCLQGWVGKQCENETVDPQCMPGWKLPRCTTDIDECSDTSLFTCGSHQLCKNNQGNYTCVCDKGWYSTDCMLDIDECEQNPCKNSGSCNNTQGSYQCHCLPGWTDTNCVTDVDECASSPCLHGGTCLNNNGSYTCSCPEGWTDRNCNTNVNECTMFSPCVNNATCTDTEGSYDCSCDPKWTGKNCSSMNYCLSSPCSNNGTCNNQPTGYNCTCSRGWSEEHCTIDIDECKEPIPPPCLNSGNCTNTNGSFYCECPVEWEGDACETDVNECLTASSPCLYDTTCNNTKGSFTCICGSGLTGRNCETDVDECLTAPCLNNGTCNNTIGSFNCACAQNWTGSMCEIDLLASFAPFSGGAGFGTENTWVILGPILVCLLIIGGLVAGIVIFNKLQSIKAQQEVAKIAFDKTKTLEPTASDKGEASASDVRPTVADRIKGTFAAGAMRLQALGSGLLNGIKGLVTRENVRKHSRSSVHSAPSAEDPLINLRHHVERQFINIERSRIVKKFYLQHSIAWLHFMTDMRQLESVICFVSVTVLVYSIVHDSIGNVAATTTVEPDVSCGNLTCHGPFTASCNLIEPQPCKCKVGFEGLECKSDVDECKKGSPCRNRGPCTNTVGSFRCACLDGWAGDHCENETGSPQECMPGWTLPRCTTDIDECSNTSLFSCGTHQRCNNMRGNYTCVCDKGWIGLDCMLDINECDQNPCQNSGTCTNTQGSFNCNCLSGWTGTLCATNVDECVVSPCMNNATCTDTEGAYACLCHTKWTGKNCSIENHCFSSPCSNNGTCNNQPTGYNCSCQRGWTGEKCTLDIDECNNPRPACMNNGNCTNTEGSFYCECPVEWEGDTCETDVNECLSTSAPCMYESTCSNTKGSYFCICGSGLTGRNCESDLDECLTAPCLNNGTCNNTVGSFNCACTRNWTGTMCEVDLSASFAPFSGGAGFGTENTWVISGPVLVCLLVVGGLVAGIVVFNKLQSNKIQHNIAHSSADKPAARSSSATDVGGTSAPEVKPALVDRIKGTLSTGMMRLQSFGSGLWQGIKRLLTRV
ncbi:neurogenic locus notch homolog protein 2-like [Dreissena polymorpha]|nr:neurogenic locus notch homolog protein 2-like [Dreissena polymorpha]